MDVYKWKQFTCIWNVVSFSVDEWNLYFTDLQFPEKKHVRNDFPHQNTAAVKMVKGQFGLVAINYLQTVGGVG